MTTLELQKPVVQHWLKTGEGISIRQLAVLTEHSESAVRRNLDQGVDGITRYQKYTTTLSRNNPLIEHGYVQTYLYWPTRDLLRELLLNSMGIEVGR